MSTLTGTWTLLRLILRRDRLLMPLWVVFLGLVPLAYAPSFRDLFPTDAARAQYAAAGANNAGFVALYGRLDGSSLGELVAWRAGFVPVMIALISLLVVIRHTRVEEETGRRELVGSTVVGRHAGLAAALIATLAANLLVAVVLALGTSGEGLPVAGSWAFGLEFAAAGWAFAGVGAVAAQLTRGAGGARGIAIGVLGAAYVLRVVGDLSGMGGGGLSWLTWLSPIGWAQRLHPYSGDQWWVLALPAACTSALAVLAVALSGRRDVGGGLLPERTGPATAAPSLRSPSALAWRLHRGLLAGWIAGFLALGVVFGGVAKSTGDLLDENPNLQQVFARLGGKAAIVDSYFAAVMGILGLVAAGYAIQATMRLRAEETSLRAEPLLTTGVGRLRWAGSHLVFSVLGPALALAVGGLAAGLTHGLNTGDLGQVPRVWAAALAQLPAVWVLAAVAVALVGLVPRLAPAAWGALAACLLLGLVGAALQLSHWLLDVSPFTHIPRLPGGTVRTAPLLWLVALAVALGVAGLVGLRRRDIPVG
ncbi:MAG TPA: ABC transporter permease [Micromonosporaceae bacterium]